MLNFKKKYLKYKLKYLNLKFNKIFGGSKHNSVQKFDDRFEIIDFDGEYHEYYGYEKIEIPTILLNKQYISYPNLFTYLKIDNMKLLFFGDIHIDIFNDCINSLTTCDHSNKCINLIDLVEFIINESKTKKRKLDIFSEIDLPIDNSPSLHTQPEMALTKFNNYFIECKKKDKTKCIELFGDLFRFHCCDLTMTDIECTLKIKDFIIHIHAERTELNQYIKNFKKETITKNEILENLIELLSTKKQYFDGNKFIQLFTNIIKCKKISPLIENDIFSKINEIIYKKIDDWIKTIIHKSKRINDIINSFIEKLKTESYQLTDEDKEYFIKIINYVKEYYKLIFEICRTIVDFYTLVRFAKLYSTNNIDISIFYFGKKHIENLIDFFKELYPDIVEIYNINNDFGDLCIKLSDDENNVIEI